jgi:plasmid replication initiation protein
VINTALQKINEITDLSIINCEYLKSGRKITSIKITAKPKIHVLDQPLQVNTEKEITEAAASLTSIGIVEETAKSGYGSLVKVVSCVTWPIHLQCKSKDMLKA